MLLVSIESWLGMQFSPHLCVTKSCGCHFSLLHGESRVSCSPPSHRFAFPIPWLCCTRKAVCVENRRIE